MFRVRHRGKGDGGSTLSSSLRNGNQLPRMLGPFDAAALVISNVIGIGIFTTPGLVAQLVPHPLLMLGLWLLGGGLALVGASAYSELAALRPRAGGEYVYLHQAFGSLPAFLSGWTSFAAGFSGAIAAGAVGFAAYLSHYIPRAGDTRPLLSIPLFLGTLEVSSRSIVALSCIALLSAIHLCGLAPGRIVQNTLAGLQVLALLLLIVLGFSLGHGSIKHFAVFSGTAKPFGLLLALVPVMFTYSGWNAAAYVAEEIREPSQNVPRALALGTCGVTVLYVLLNSVYIYAAPTTELSRSINTGELAARALLGERATSVITPVILVALAGAISAMILAGPRVYFAMARDGLFPIPLGRVHPRFQTPVAAILAQAIWSGVLVISGTFDQILLFTGFAVVLFSGIAVLSVFVLRWKLRNEPRRVRAWGFPWLPAIFVAVSLAMVVNAFRQQPKPSAAGVLVIAAGLPVYWWFVRQVSQGH